MANWRRAMWFDDTKLPWVKPSPNLPTLTSALVYPALVPFEGTNVSVGRGTNEAFQRVGAPWFKADSVAKLLTALELRAEGGGGEEVEGLRRQVKDLTRQLEVARIELARARGGAPDAR
jgi:hypothetical protein